MTSHQKKKRKVRSKRPSSQLKTRTKSADSLDETKRWSGAPDPAERLPNSMSNRFLIGSLIASVLLVALGIYIVQAGNPDNRKDNRGSLASLTNQTSRAESILRQVENAYRAIRSYADETEMSVQYAPGPQHANAPAAASRTIRLAYERPNKIRITVNGPNDTSNTIDLACNEETLRSRIEWGNMIQDQLVERSPPKLINLTTLYSATEASDVDRPDELLSLLMPLPVGLQISQVALLLAGPNENLFERTFNASFQKSMLPDQALDGVNCLRIRIESRDNDEIEPVVLWIDKNTKLLKQIEIPSFQARSVYRRTQINQPIAPATFSIDIERNEKLVRHFVVQPNNEIPPLLGMPPGPFEFTRLNGQSLRSDEFQGRVTVLCWFDSREAGRHALTKLSAAFKEINKSSNSDQVSVLAVCSEPSTRFGHDSIRNLMRRWKIDLPVARDLKPLGPGQFKIPATPCFVVIDREGFVQLHEVGVSPDLDVELPALVENLLEGKNIAADYLQFVKSREAVYQRLLLAAGVQAPKEQTNIVATKIAKPTQPERLELVRLWKNQELHQPGNMVVARETKGDSLIAVLDGTKRIRFIDSKGRVKNQLAVAVLDSESPITQLEIAEDSNTNRHVLGWSTLGRQLTVFDENWRQKFVYPRSNHLDSQQGLILGAHLADLDSDGGLEIYVSFDNRETHRVDVTGHTVWKRSTPSPLLSLTSSIDRTQKSFLLGTTQSGQISPMNSLGALQRPLDVGSRAIHHLVASRPNNSDSVYCGFSALPTGRMQAIGIRGNMQEQWNYVLPSGTFTNQIQYATSLPWRDSTCWILAAANGSLHFIVDDGSFHDHFNTGKQLTGLAAYQTGDTNILVLSSADDVEAYRFQPK